MRINIYKQTLQFTQMQSVGLLNFLGFASLDLQDGVPCLWYVRTIPEDDCVKISSHKVLAFFTGESFDSSILKDFYFIGTLQDEEGLVWHFFFDIK